MNIPSTNCWFRLFSAVYPRSTTPLFPHPRPTGRPSLSSCRWVVHTRREKRYKHYNFSKCSSYGWEQTGMFWMSGRGVTLLLKGETKEYLVFWYNVKSSVQLGKCQHRRQQSDKRTVITSFFPPAPTCVHITSRKNKKKKEPNVNMIFRRVLHLPACPLTLPALSCMYFFFRESWSDTANKHDIWSICIR